uniref:Porphobilinogen deaminase (PBG) (Hydroxymethylbilane synthase) (HMBS) (Pre-uroporphyrinogen synthase) (Modular protein) n=1 Tax=mine drainage metagenome TaxID=410659 RepID=E6PCY6_9ZZZZ
MLLGAGSVAARKARTFVEAGAKLSVVAPTIGEAMEALLAAHPDVRCERRAYREEDLAGAFLCVAATDSPAVNEGAMRAARERGILTIDSTDPARGDATMPAVVRVGELTFSIDSGASTPAFSKRIAREIAVHFDARYDAAARTLAIARSYVRETLSPSQRAVVMRALSELPLDDLAAMDRNRIEDAVEATAATVLADGAAPSTSSAICATRGSALALWQSRHVAARLAQSGIATTMLALSTVGDRDRSSALAAMGEQAIFVKELERALADGRADYAVHSAKDLPSALPAGMQLSAISSREDPRDVYCSERYATFAELPAGARVGTSSPRRRAQLYALRSDLAYVEIRGNVDTRLRKLREGEYDAIVLAAAGLRRLSLHATHTVPFPVEQLLPAAGQGALAIETLRDAPLASALRAALNDERSERAVIAERAALRELGAGCTAPVGIHGAYEGGELLLRGRVSSTDGAPAIAAELRAPAADSAAAEELGCSLARALLARGAASLLPHGGPLAGRRIVLPRSVERTSRIAARLRALGAEVTELRAGEEPDEAPVDLLAIPSSGAAAVAAPWLLLWGERGVRPLVVAMGPESASAIERAGLPPDGIAPIPEIDAFTACIVSLLASP